MNFAYRVIAVLIVIFMSGCGIEKDSHMEGGCKESLRGFVSVPDFEFGESYSEVRSRLLSSNWRPVTSHSSNICSESDARCIGRPEVDACTGTGYANCKFVWSKGDIVLSIFTVGEDADVESYSLEKSQHKCDSHKCDLE